MQAKRKKTVCFLTVILIAFLVFFFIQNKGMRLQASAVGIVNTNGQYLNVRTGPGTSYDKLTSGGTGIVLSDKAKVTILAQNGKWYHVSFKLNGKTLKGYVSSAYVTVLTGKVYTEIAGKASGTTEVRTKADSKAETVKAAAKNLSLNKGKEVKILSETITGGKKWYYISVVYNKKTYKGYVLSSKIVPEYKKGLPGILKVEKSVNLLKEAGKKTQVLANKKKVTLANGKQVTILSEKSVSGKEYLYIKVTYNGVSVKGYLLKEQVLFQIVKKETEAATPTIKPTTKPTATPKVTPKPTTKPKATPKPTAKPTATPVLSDKEYREKLKKDGFPDSYLTPLVNLHKKFPKWTFKPYKTGLNWDTVIANESKVGLNLLSVNKSHAWKSTEEGAYNWKTDKYIPYDGSTWVTASKKAVKYYMDPRNFLDERGIFQFESLEYQKDSHTQSGVEKILNNTPMHNKTYTYLNDKKESKTIKYSKTFMNAAKASGVSPYHLASRCKQEVVINATMMSSSVSGNVSGYKGIYNFYNIGANNSTVPGGAIANGLNWASSGTTYSRPWNTPYKSIVGGASFIGKTYINVGQNTLYLEKFNVTSKNRYSHQYMANVEAPNSEATKTYSGYGEDKKDMSMVFSIPVYNNMPASPCAVPSGGKNPNNYLKSLSVKGHTFNSKFVLGDDGSKTYTVTVKNSVESVTINAQTVSTYANLSGTGEKKLNVGENSFTIKVTSESGKTRNYIVKITRSAS